jgi:multiple sugar transport system substrate-binding protein
MAAAATLLAAGTLAACSGGSGSTTSGSKTLRVLIAAPQEGAGKALQADYEKSTGTKVKITVVPYDQIQTKAILDAQSGANQYDVIQYWYTSVGALAQADALDDLTGWVDKDKDIDKSDFIAPIYNAYTQYKGKTYGLPFDGDTHLLYYNKKILADNGVKPPTTWDEYLADVKKITDANKSKGIYGAVMMGDKSAFNIGSTFFNRLATFSSSPIDSQKPDLTSPAALAAAKSMVDAAPYTAPSPSQIGFDQALALFLSGKIGMMEAWTDLGTFAQDPSQSKIADNWGAVPLPAGAGGKTAAPLDAGWALGVSPSAPDQDAAKDFVKFATSKAENLKLVTTTGSGVDPTRTSTLESDKYKSFTPVVAAALTQILGNAQSWPTSPNAPKMIQSLNDNLAQMLQGSLTPQQALDATEKAWDAL